MPRRCLPRSSRHTLISLGADEPLNAARCATRGVAHEEVRDAMASVLDDGTYSQPDERMRDEIAAVSGVARAVRLLERLVLRC
jgi:UDP:flavonoid glycosyltransferase YjiC (YdhE family)